MMLIGITNRKNKLMISRSSIIKQNKIIVKRDFQKEFTFRQWTNKDKVTNKMALINLKKSKIKSAVSICKSFGILIKNVLMIDQYQVIPE